MRPVATARGWYMNTCKWRQVAQRMHDPNGIVDAWSASPLAPDSMAVIGDEGLWSLTSSPSHCNYKYILSHCGPIFLYRTVMGAELGQKMVSLETAFLISVAKLQNIHWIWFIFHFSVSCCQQCLNLLLKAVAWMVDQNQRIDAAAHSNTLLHTATRGYTQVHPVTPGIKHNTQQHTATQWYAATYDSLSI